jgi:hypothetical protein
MIKKSPEPRLALSVNRERLLRASSLVRRGSAFVVGHRITFNFMLLLKRIATSIVLFVFFFVVLYFAICIVGAGINGAMAGAGTTNAEDGYNAGAQAGANFVRHNMAMILLSSFVISFLSSLSLSFSGILPWCRKPSQPPPL